METLGLETIHWVKSSHSGGGGNQCVEIATWDGVILARDSKNPAGPRLIFDRVSWAGFIGQVKSGSFDQVD
ncbi:DUF397 domain-containing protein [Actinomadura macrotermitis]|uniref:DUF397 domain-containing protein n=1 Tax=Actinomadura macrotermitis TaxID=2585200 RepID=A0A7K0BRK1_9ACTN|nr:DUF397 domain-containing protein [Actinomadura macrotermitis]MQY03757.1 hypothetical protein [Actinomadura macrotermitis]